MADENPPEILRRPRMLQPGRLLYQPSLNQKKLKCLYGCMGGCCACEKAASRTVFDIYTNGILTNTPVVCCCCMTFDRSQFLFWDNPNLGTHGVAGCCKPFPCFCPHCCGLCGEVYYFFRIFACCPNNCTTGFGHTGFCAFMCCCSCCILDQFCGLSEGEGEKITQVVSDAMAGNFQLIAYPPLHTEPMMMQAPSPLVQVAGIAVAPAKA